MRGSNLNRWTDDQLSLLQKLRAGGVGWGHVSVRCGHPVASCRQMMTRYNNARRVAQYRAECKALREAADLVNVIEPRPAPVPKKKPPARPQPISMAIRPAIKPAQPLDHARSSISAARLIMDAELRRRIELLGATGGLLGDPEPGRSALDRRNAMVPR
jgi:hypothetical protein